MNILGPLGVALVALLVITGSIMLFAKWIGRIMNN